MTLDSNERSGFQARELKSVHIDVQAALLKLVFLKCHSNNYNTYNQIGLVALNCIGPADNLSLPPQGVRRDSTRENVQQTPTANRLME